MTRSKRFIVFGIMMCLLMSGCSNVDRRNRLNSVDKPALPKKLSTDSEGIPVLDVYDISAKKLERMDIETYVAGVVAGEMKNDWPLEALKAQAILARTFVLKFCDTKQSRYEGADISTDVEEAQAYAPESINARVQKAIEETRGVVMSADGEYPYAWFFAHAGGKTDLPSVGLDFSGDDPEYLTSVESSDSEKAPENVKSWTAAFTEDETLAAAKKLGLAEETIKSIEIGETGESGRANTLKINGQTVSAPSFRIAVGANKLKSTLITDIVLREDSIIFTGKGYGHGVGMSQWGAYALAEEGKTAQEIVKHYFRGIDLVDMW